MPQDYAALAAQLGGAPAEAQVDVAALAAELGGVAADDPIEQRFPGLRVKLREHDAAVRKSTVPTMAAAGGFAGGIPGAMLGAYAGTRLQGGDVGEGAWEAGKQAAGGLALKGAIAGAGKLVEPVKEGATKLVLSYVKPRFSDLQRRAGVEGSTPTVVAKRIARFMVDHGLTTAQKAQDLAKASGQQVDDAVAQAEAANPNLALDTAQRIPRYFNKVLRRVEQQWLPGKDRAAIQNVGKELVEDSPLSRSTYRPPADETLEAGLVRGASEGRTMAENFGRSAPRGPESQFTDPGGAFPRSARPRALRTDVKPSEGVTMSRTKSFFDKDASGGEIAGGKTIERAVRDAIKQAVPETRAPLMRQGRAMDATRLLERGEHLAQNRDTLGGFAQTMGLAGNLRGLLAQLLKESQLRIGAGAAPRVARALERTGNMDPSALQAAIAQLLAVSHDQE